MDRKAPCEILPGTQIVGHRHKLHTRPRSWTPIVFGPGGRLDACHDFDPVEDGEISVPEGIGVNPVGPEGAIRCAEKTVVESNRNLHRRAFLRRWLRIVMAVTSRYGNTAYQMRPRATIADSPRAKTKKNERKLPTRACLAG